MPSGPHSNWRATPIFVWLTHTAHLGHCSYFRFCPCSIFCLHFPRHFDWPLLQFRLDVTIFKSLNWSISQLLTEVTTWCWLSGHKNNVLKFNYVLPLDSCLDQRWPGATHWWWPASPAWTYGKGSDPPDQNISSWILLTTLEAQKGLYAPSGVLQRDPGGGL